jgi:hypothetical protein
MSDTIKYVKTTNYEFDINGKKIELSFDEILLLQETLKNIISGAKDTKVVFLD